MHPKCKHASVNTVNVKLKHACMHDTVRPHRVHHILEARTHHGDVKVLENLLREPELASHGDFTLRRR